MYNTSDYRADSRNHDQGAEYRRAAQEVRDFEDFGLTPLTSRENTPRLELGISMSENNGNTLPWTGIPLNLKESSQSWFVDETDCEQPTDTNGSINQIPDGGSDCDEKRVENESMNYEKLTLQELAKHCNLPPNTPSFQLPWALHENTQHSGQSVDLEAYTTSENDPNEIVRSVLCDTSQCDIEQANRTILSGDNHLLSPQPKIEPSSQLRYILTPDSSSRPFLISEPKVALPTCTSPMILRESNSFSERTCSTASEPPVVANHLINFSLLKKETESVHSQHHHKRSPIQRDPHISEEITLPLYADCFTNYRLDAAKRRRIKQSIRKARRSEDVPKGKTGTGKQGRKLQTKRNRAISHITNQILEKPLSPQNSSTSSLSETDTLKQANTIAKDIPDRLTAAASSSSAENLLSTACGRVIKLKKPANKGRKSVSVCPMFCISIGCDLSWISVCCHPLEIPGF